MRKYGIRLLVQCVATVALYKRAGWAWGVVITFPDGHVISGDAYGVSPTSEASE